MRYGRFAPSILFLLFSAITISAQTPASAQKYFQQGVKNLADGNLAMAFENYSRAIEISSRLDSRSLKSSNLAAASNFDRFSEVDNVTVIDPFTAYAYTNRAIVRYRQNDVDGAIADFNAALRI